MSMQGAKIVSPEDYGALPLDDQINHLVDTAVAKLDRPTSADHRLLVLKCEVGTFRVKPGDHVTAAASWADPVAATVSDGSGTWRLDTGEMLVLTAPTEITVRGFGAGASLAYAWVRG